MRKKKTKLTQEEVLKYYVGKDSIFEGDLAKLIESVTGSPANFHPKTFRYTQPAKTRRYTPDFLLPNGIFIESKGRFSADDRQKHLLVKQQFPELDIRFVLYRANTKIDKRSATTVEAWLDKNGFTYSVGTIPTEWFITEDKTK